MFILCIYEYGNDKPVKELGYQSMRDAEKAQSGLDRQLNHEKFYTQVELSSDR